MWTETYQPRLTEKQIDMVDDALRNYFDAHHDRTMSKQEAGELLNLIIETRINLAQSLPCSECNNRRMGWHSDLCSEHYAQLTRGELKVKI